MLITNGTKFKIRLSEIKDKSEDETYEAFAFVIASGNSLSVPEEDYTVYIEEE